MKVYAGPDLTTIGHLKNVLDTHGIASLIRGVHRGGLFGITYPTDLWSELWVMDASQGEKAKQIVNDALKPSAHETILWACAKCSEELEGQFTVCWKCGTSRPEMDSI